MKTSLTHFLMLAVAVALAAALPSARADTNLANTFSFVSSGTAVLNTNLALRDARFTAVENVTVDRFAFYVNASAGNPAIKLSLQTDSGGNPSGTILASGVITPGATGASALYGLFTNSASLTKGTVYHFVVQVTNGSPTDTLTSHHKTGADLTRSPTTGDPDPSLNYLSSANGGASWTPQANQSNANTMVFAVGNAAGHALGQPVSGGLGQPGVGGSTTHGESFIWTGDTGSSVTSITLRVRANGADNLNVFLLSSSLGILSSNVLVNGGFSSGANYSNFTVTLSAPITLTNGLSYKLVGQSAGSTNNSYLLYGQAVSLTNMFGASFGGTNDYALNGTGLTSFSNASSATAAYDLWFNLGILQAIPEPTAMALALLGLGALALRRRTRA
jgi:hypothetical protein